MKFNNLDANADAWSRCLPLYIVVQCTQVCLLCASACFSKQPMPLGGPLPW